MIKRRAETISLVALCLALFAASLFASTRHDDFPYYCHHDEPFKVEQVVTRSYNFHHPQLLLQATDLVRRARGVTDDPQQVVMCGRLISAIFAAASVVLLALLGWKAFGLLGAWCVGVSVAVCPYLGLTAHFMKEDTSLLLGLSAFLLALASWWERRTARRTIWLGLACGLAVSAKFVAVVCLLFALGLVLAVRARAGGPSRGRRLVLLVVPAVLLFLAINVRLFDQFDRFTLGLGESAALITQGRRSTDLPNLRVFARFVGVAWPVLAMAGVGVLAMLAWFRRTCTAGWAFLGMGLVFTGMLLLTPLGVPDRYLLVPAVSLHALAGLGIVLLVERAARNRGVQSRRAMRQAGAVAALALVTTALPAFRALAVDAFDQADARAELIAWTRANLGSDASLAASHRVRLPEVHGMRPADPALRFASRPMTWHDGLQLDGEAVRAMRGQGVTHVILRETEYRGYLGRSRTALDPADTSGAQPAREPEVVWRTPPRFESKNRWLGENLVVLRL